MDTGGGAGGGGGGGPIGAGVRVKPVPMEKRFYGVPVFPGPSTSSSMGSPGNYYGPPALSPTAPYDRYNGGGVGGVGGRPASVIDDRILLQAVTVMTVETPSPAVTDPVTARRPATNSTVTPAAATAPPAAAPAATAAVAAVAAVSDQLRWKLHHVDFLPAPVKSKKDDEHERFTVLIDRANQWSAQNPQFLVFSCETVTWSTVDRTIFTDSGVMIKSMASDKKTKMLRGLRVWYFVYDDTFYDGKSNPGPFKLGCTNYTLDGKADAILTLLAKVNSDMFKRTVAGRILKVETLTMLSDVGEADVCAWSEQPDKSRDYATFLRLFYVFKKDGAVEDCKYGDIGIRDFVPAFDQRTPLNQGYEVFADLWSKAARWIYINPQLKFINAQGVFVKIKKEGEGQTAATSLWDRCLHREHASAYGSISHQKTEYYQILRIIYHQPPASSSTPAKVDPSSSPSPSGAGPNGSIQSDASGAGAKKLYYKTFIPAPLKRPVASSGAADEGGAEPPVEGLYEDLRQLEEKINAWLFFSGAKVSSVETLPTRLQTGGQDMIGPEATYVYNDREKNQNREQWRANVRLYLDGEFHEPPPTWRNSIVERKSTSFTAGSTANHNND